MQKDEWIKRCAERYKQRAGLDDEQARAAAEATFEAQQEFGDDLTPEDAADEDMDCWTDDGD